jgi:hypothetical protein
MAPTRVAGDLYFDIDGQIFEIKRQLRQKGGYPFDPMRLAEHLQAAIEGHLVDHNGDPFVVLFISRKSPFDLKKFTLGYCTIAEQDERSIKLTKIDLASVRLVSALEKGEHFINVEKSLKRFKEKNQIRLDAKVFQTLWENQSLIPNAWKKEVNGWNIKICFDGTIFESKMSSNVRSIFYLQWRDNQWTYRHSLLMENRDAGMLSAVLEIE